MPFETKIFMTIMFFLAIAGFLSAILPSYLQIVSPFNFAFLGGSFIGVAGACAVATGLPCAAALAIFGVADILSIFVTGLDWIGAIIFVPLTMVILYLAVRIARGGG
jgi:hypothetical protein